MCKSQSVDPYCAMVRYTTPLLHHRTKRSEPPKELARPSHASPQHDIASVQQSRAPVSIGNVSGSMVTNDSHYHYPMYRQQHHQEVAQPQHHQMNHNRITRQPPTRAQLSPNFQCRSSPIAIIHNPEDNVNQAKFRWRHPMYDDADDEMEEMLSEGGGVSVASLTSPLEGPFNCGPKSLPTALLRAPKLGSLPSQDYRLKHLASLPPPLSLNGDLDLGTSAMDETDTTNAANITGTYALKPKFFSSYGSLREAHLTGRYATTNHQAVSTGQLLQNPKQKAEPPATLIPPQNPTPLNLCSMPPQKKQPPANTMSIRDRMLQKAQQKKDEATKESRGGEQKMAASSLAAMMAEDKNDSPSIKAVDETAAQPRRASGLPAHVAKEAAAISYNSNLNLFASAQNGQQQIRGSEQLHGRQEEVPPMMLSSSMTGLEVLRAASKAKPTEHRPTSLSTLQGSSPAKRMAMAPPPSTMHHPPTFMQLSRTMSEPAPQTFTSPQQHSQPPAQHTTPIFTRHYAIPSHAVDAESAEMPMPSLVRLPDGRVLIPPQKFRSTNMLALSSLTTQQKPAQSVQLPQEHQHHSSWGMPASMTSIAGMSPLGNNGASPPNRPEESNPDAEGAFDMDFE